jgi:hypothetical protein
VGLSEVPDTLEDFPWFFPGDKVICLADDAWLMGLSLGTTYTIAARSNDGLYFFDELPDDTVGFLGLHGFKKIRS